MQPASPAARVEGAISAMYELALPSPPRLLHNPRLPRQGREPRKREAGNAWSFSEKGFLKHKTRLLGDIALCRLDYPRELEIDTLSDLSVIESIMNVNNTA